MSRLLTIATVSLMAVAALLYLALNYLT